ncbi:unnamed protein product [Trichogramma brassicae]|uniref:Uncharacterized protein n=1 Tax=Trichogramma brassicae TaxID=86971 RepID=A0A6H5INC9_9HYME|nr:unnamed protein product [Trichogramma brassicae]
MREKLQSRAGIEPGPNRFIVRHLPTAPFNSCIRVEPRRRRGRCEWSHRVLSQPAISARTRIA